MERMMFNPMAQMSLYPPIATGPEFAYNSPYSAFNAAYYRYWCLNNATHAAEEQRQRVQAELS